MSKNSQKPTLAWRQFDAQSQAKKEKEAAQRSQALKEAADREEKRLEKIAADNQKNIEKLANKIEALIKESIDAKKTTNQNHLGFVTAVVGGFLATNLILLQNGTPTDTALKFGLIISGGILINEINKHFGKRKAVLKEVLREANKIADEFRDGKKDIKIPSFPKLHAKAFENLLSTKEGRKKIVKEFNGKAANWAVYIVTSVCIISAGDKIYTYQNSIRDEDVKQVKELSLDKFVRPHVPNSPN